MHASIGCLSKRPDGGYCPTSYDHNARKADMLSGNPASFYHFSFRPASDKVEKMPFVFPIRRTAAGLSYTSCVRASS
jgi:hypothetical protein